MHEVMFALASGSTSTEGRQTAIGGRLERRYSLGPAKDGEPGHAQGPSPRQNPRTLSSVRTLQEDSRKIDPLITLCAGDRHPHGP